MSGENTEHCLAGRGSFTSDDQEFSSYPYVFDSNCPDGVTDVDVSRRYQLKGRCHPLQPPFQNQYTLGSHFQDLYRRADCPSCPEDAPGNIMPNNTCIAFDGPCGNIVALNTISGAQSGAQPGAQPGKLPVALTGPSISSATIDNTPPPDRKNNVKEQKGLSAMEYGIPLLLLIMILLFLALR